MPIERRRKLTKYSIITVLVVIFGVLFMNSSYGILFGVTQSYPHYIQTVVPSAYEVIPGERMVAAGETVGEITAANVTRTGQAHIVMGIDNNEWPIPADSVLTLRQGGTIKYTDRFINIAKGNTRTYFADNAYVPAKQFIVPVEYDQLFNVFNKPTRVAMESFFKNGGDTFTEAVKPLHAALNVASPALQQASAVFKDVGYDQQALSTLVSSTAEVSDAVQSSNPGLQTLLQSGANTFGLIAEESKNLGKLIDDGEPSLKTQGILYYHIGRTVPKLAKLAAKLAPGVTQLSGLATPLDYALREVVNIEPTAVHTLRTVATAGPRIDTLLTSARTTLMPELSALQPLASKELGCIRPYTPDIIGFLQGWGGFLGNGENKPKLDFLHSYISIFPLPNATPLNSVQLHKLLPGTGVEAEGIPGTSWNQPWYQPQCNITAKSLNPALDDNNNTYDPNGTKLVPYPTS